MTSDDEALQPAPGLAGAEPNPPVDQGEWRPAHWAFIAIGALRNLRGWLIPLVFIMITQGFRGTRADFIWYGVAAFATIASVAGSLVEWSVYRYRVGERDITLRSGIIAKHERVIPFERIQAVNVTEAPLERLFGVVRLEIDTGASGSQQAEITLQAITRADAAALRAHLLAARQRLRGGDAVAPATIDATDQPVAVVSGALAGEGVLLHRLSTKDLLIAGATSGRIGAAAAIAGILLQLGDEIVPRSLWERVPWEGLADSARDVQVIASLVVTLGVIAWLISIAATVLTYGGFELRREGDQLLVRHGVLDRRRVTIPVRRIQAIRVVETMFRQPFGYAEIRFDVAGAGAEEGGRGVLTPLVKARDVPALLADACPAFAFGLDGQPLQQLPRRARRRYVMAASVGWVVFVLAVAALAWWLRPEAAPWALVGLVITPLFAALGLLRYRDAGWLIDDSRFLLRRREVSRVTMLTQVRRLQYRGLRADPFQRRAGLATFYTAVASGGMRQGVSLVHLDARVAAALARRLGPKPPPPPAAADPGTA